MALAVSIFQKVLLRPMQRWQKYDLPSLSWIFSWDIQQLRGSNFTPFWPSTHLEWTMTDILLDTYPLFMWLSMNFLLTTYLPFLVYWVIEWPTNTTKFLLVSAKIACRVRLTGAVYMHQYERSADLLFFQQKYHILTTNQRSVDFKISFWCLQIFQKKPMKFFPGFLP